MRVSAGAAYSRPRRSSRSAAWKPTKFYLAVNLITVRAIGSTFRRRCAHAPTSGDGTNLSIIWQELDGPTVKSEALFSYGTDLIRNLIPHELGGKIDLMFAPAGVSCRIEFPIKQH